MVLRIILLSFTLAILNAVDGIDIGKYELTVMGSMISRENFVNVGSVDASQYHEILIALKQNNLDTIDSMLMERSTPGSRNYQEWLSFDEIGEWIRNDEAVDAVTTWIQGIQGANITWMSPRKEYFKVNATISIWERELNSKFYLWDDQSQHITGSTSVYVLAKEYSMPTSLLPYITSIFNTVQVPPQFRRKFYRKPKSQAESHVNNVNPLSLRISSNAVTVSFLNKLYDITSNVGNSSLSQSVFETNSESFSQNDLNIFQQNFGLPQQKAVDYNGFNVTTCGTNCYEGNLDIQYIMGVAQQTTSIYWYVAGDNPFLSYITSIASLRNPPLVNSISWGGQEYQYDSGTLTSFNNEAMKAGLMGVTIVVSSADNGVADLSYTTGLCQCDVSSSSSILSYSVSQPWTGKGYFPSFPATSPYVVAVGATQGPNNGYPEIACQGNLGGVITSGGGFSTYYSRPSWQDQAVSSYFTSLSPSEVPASGYNPNGRGYPDVSLIGVNYAVVIDGSISSLYGTSASAPVFGAFISLINAFRSKYGLKGVGFINPTLYSGGYNASIRNNSVNYFNDITSGANRCCSVGKGCCKSGFNTSTGWDPVTGWGSINFPSLASLLLAGSGVNYPSIAPTSRPSVKPSSNMPSTKPTTIPSVKPSSKQTSPSFNPSVSFNPTVRYNETISPTTSISLIPTLVESRNPTLSPPSASPTSTSSLTMPPSSRSSSVIPTETPMTAQTSPPSTAFPTVSGPTYFPTPTPSVSGSNSESFLPTALTSIPTSGGSTSPSTSESTRAPTSSSTTSSSMISSSIPMFSPSFVPSTLSTSTLTALPSFHSSSAIPTETPMTAQTSAPSTAFPTVSGQTYFPTSTPSFSESFVPTALTSIPTSGGSTSPSTSESTRAPTSSFTTSSSSPSKSPTIETRTSILNFNSIIFLKNFTSMVLNTAGQQSVELASAYSFNINTSCISYISSKFVAVSISDVEGLAAFNPYVTSTHKYNVNVTIQVSFPFSGSDSSAIYDNLIKSLNSAILTGQFTVYLQQASKQYSSMTTLDADATGSSSSNYTVTYIDTSSTSSNKSNQSKTDLGISLGVILSVLIISVSTYFCYSSIAAFYNRQDIEKRKTLNRVNVLNSDTTTIKNVNAEASFEYSIYGGENECNEVNPIHDSIPANNVSSSTELNHQMLGNNSEKHETNNHTDNTVSYDLNYSDPYSGNSDADVSNCVIEVDSVNADVSE